MVAGKEKPLLVVNHPLVLEEKKPWAKKLVRKINYLISILFVGEKNNYFSK
jgi:hypothetical protein